MKILMVCLGNICRSPLAQGVLEELIQKNNLDWQVDSAGTSGFHVGNKPDPRSRDVAMLHGIDIDHQRARQFKKDDFFKFDRILAMDRSNYQKIISQVPNESYRDKVDLLLNFINPNGDQSVPDPYYEGGFEEIYTVIERACQKLIKHNLVAVS